MTDVLLLGVDRRGTGPMRLAPVLPSTVPALAPVPRDGDLPLSFSQERLWFLQQLNPESATYNLACEMPIKGPLAVGALQQALDELVRRHESLRTTFVQIDGEPFLRIDQPARLQLCVVDLRPLSDGERTIETERLRVEHRDQRFDLERGPLMRALVMQSTDEQSELLLAIHRIVSDPWSLDIVAQELGTLYCDFGLGDRASLPEPTIGYLDFASSQRHRVHHGLLDGQLTFWRQRLAGPLPVLELPADKARPARQSYCGATESRPLGAVLSDAIRTFAGQRDTSPFITFLAAFEALLGRYTGEDDILIGSPVPGRPGDAWRGVVGSFVNMLVLRADMSGDPTFDELLTRSRNMALAALANSDVPFEVLLDELQPRRDTSRSPLFQVALASESGPATGSAPQALTALSRGGALFDLTLIVSEWQGQWSVTAEYNVDLFERSTVARMLGHFETLLAAAIEDPGIRLSALPLMPTGESRQVLREWNDTAAEVGGTVVHALVELQAARTPQAIAVMCEDASITYGDLNRRANQLAHCLRALGIAPDALVGICVDRSINALIGLLGILKAGGAYVPLDPKYPADRLEYMLADAGISMIVSEGQVLQAIQVGNCRVVCLDRDWPEIAAQPSANPDFAVSGEDLAYVIYTSGSTGRPKGVQVPHRAVVNLLRAVARFPGLERGDVLAAVTTLSFDIAGLELYLPLMCGATVAMVGREDASDGARLKARLASSGITAMQATPATWRLLLEAGWTDPHLKMLCGGEALPRDLAAAMLVAGGELWNLYGPTETTIWSTVGRIPAPDDVTIGRPIANTQVYVLDRHLQPVPGGVLGELYIAGDGVARGYRRRPDLTAERFLPNPFGAPGSRMYRTGDLVRLLSDGRIDCIGRLDYQVKMRGFRVEPGEIEAALIAHPAVADAVVLAHEIDHGDRRLVAYLTCHPGDSLTTSELRRLVRNSLPEYMVPSFFVTLDRIPRTPNGKVDRHALPPPFRGELPSGERPAPTTVTERLIADIWQRALHIPTISAEDNFFDIGGHSLLSMRVVAEIARVVGHQVNPGSMFMENLKQIAAACDRGLAGLRVSADTGATVSASAIER